MKLSVTKEFEFCAAHYLPGHELCGRMHGHNYRVLVTFEGGASQDQDMVVDFKQIKKVIQPIINHLDHTLLNELNAAVLPNFDFALLAIPTAENIAKVIFHSIPELVGVLLTEVIVYETPTCSARYGL